MCSRLMMSGPFGLSCWFAGAVFVLGDLMLRCLQSSSFSSSFSSSSKELLTREPADRCLDSPKGMSSCKLQLHHTLWINCGCGVIGGGANANTDREAPPSHVKLCQSSSRETEEGVCVFVCWCVEGYRGVWWWAKPCLQPMCGKVNSSTKPGWFSQNYILISAENRSLQPVLACFSLQMPV